MESETGLKAHFGVTRTKKRVPEWVMPATKVAVFAADILLSAFCFLAAFMFRSGKSVVSDDGWGWSQDFSPYAGILAFAVVARALMLLYQRVYDLGGAFTYTREAIKVFKAILVSSLLIVAWAFLFRGGFAFREFSYSRGVFLIDFGIALGAFTLFHLSIRALQARFRERGINLIPTVVVGNNSEAMQTITELTERRHLGYRVIGMIADSPPETPAEGAAMPALLGSVDELSDIIRELEIQEVIITDTSIKSERLFDAMMAVGRSQRVEFRFAPSLFDLLPQKTSVDQIGVLPMVRLFRDPLSDGQRLVKRLSDIVIATIAAIVSAPIWLAAAIAVKLDSPGNVMFRQERVGMDGRVFLCYKFRTMRSDADDSLHREAYTKNIAGRSDGDSALHGKVKDDPRITRVGSWLRRSSIDELPQLINVIRGDMSIVGPRPPIPYEVEQYEPWHRKRLDMKPGITGLWQVSGRNRLTFEEMVRVDLYYIENWSLLLDLRILLLTIPAILRGDETR